MIIGKFEKMSADEKKSQTNKCCICGREFLGFGNNPAPYKENGRCCNRCNYDYVIPSRMYLMGLGARLTEKKAKKELRQFIKRYHLFPYNFSDELMVELGGYIIKGIEEKGYCHTTNIKVEDFIDGMTVPIATMPKSETIECMEKYLSSIGKTLDSWIQETGYKLYWNKIFFCVAESERMKNTGCDSSDTAFVEPLIKNDTDAIEEWQKVLTLTLQKA